MSDQKHGKAVGCSNGHAHETAAQADECEGVSYDVMLHIFKELDALKGQKMRGMSPKEVALYIEEEVGVPYSAALDYLHLWTTTWNTVSLPEARVAAARRLITDKNPFGLKLDAITRS